MRKDEDTQRISQMVWRLFMKIFADKEEEWNISRKDYKSLIPERLKWQNIDYFTQKYACLSFFMQKRHYFRSLL